MTEGFLDQYLEKNTCTMTNQSAYSTLFISRERNLRKGPCTATVLAFAAYEQGHNVSFMSPEHFYVKEGELCGKTTKPNAIEIPDRTALESYLSGDITKDRIREFQEIANFDIVFSNVVFKNPDEKEQFESMAVYLATLHTKHPEIVFINRPSTLLYAGSKIYETLLFSDVMPTTHVTRDPARLKNIMREARKEDKRLIGKPTDGFGGAHVINIPLQSRGSASLAEVLVRAIGSDTYTPAIMQHEVEGVERRVLVFDGKILTAYKRVAEDPDEIRSNITLGGKREAYVVQPIDEQIVSKIGPRLVADGLYFVGIDIMGPENDGNAENTALIEVNVRSPGCLTSLEDILGVKKGGEACSKLAHKVIHFAEKLSRARKSAS